jgi:hypothetical protein
MMFPSNDPRFSYGSMYPLLYYGCLEDLTKTRIKQLQLWAFPDQKVIQGSIGNYNGEY